MCQELCLQLRRAYQQWTYEGAEVAQEVDLGAITVECQHWDGQMVEITPGMELDGLADVRALFVTTNISQAAVLSSASSALPVVSTRDEEEDDRSEVSLIDLSLAGCCGVQSTWGGLRINSDMSAHELDGAQARKEQRQSELSRFRAAKFRHYFTL